MPTASEAYGVIRSKLEANIPLDRDGVPILLRWHGDKVRPLLPDEATPLAFTLFDAQRSSVIEVGGGRGRNRHRNPGSAEIYVFVPEGWGLQPTTDLAEAVATIFRPMNESGVVVESATVYPGGPGSELNIPGLQSEVGNYFYAACGIEFYFDLIG